MEGLQIDQKRILSQIFSWKLSYFFQNSYSGEQLGRLLLKINWDLLSQIILAVSPGKGNCCPLIWMCHNRTTNGKMNRLNERCFPITYDVKQSSFKMLLEKDSSASIHDKSIQCLAIEIYKVSNWLSPLQTFFSVSGRNPVLAVKTHFKKGDGFFNGRSPVHGVFKQQ